MANRKGKIYGDGSYCQMKTNIDEVTIKDFQNPWTFYNLFSSENAVLFQWLRNHGLLAEIIMCPGEKLPKSSVEKRQQTSLLLGAKKSRVEYEKVFLFRRVILRYKRSCDIYEILPRRSHIKAVCLSS